MNKPWNVEDFAISWLIVIRDTWVMNFGYPSMTGLWRRFTVGGAGIPQSCQLHLIGNVRKVARQRPLLTNAEMLSCTSWEMVVCARLVMCSSRVA